MKQRVFVSRMVAASAVTIIVFMAGCSILRSDPESLTPVYHPEKVISVHFGRPLIIQTPKRDPVTVEEYIRCGLFYFEQGRFAEAAGAFEKAKEGIRDPWTPLYRSCLVSEAICHLLTDNRSDFTKAVKEIRSTYTAYELMVIGQQDPRMNTLFGLYRQFSENEGGAK